jgi:soluble lytic murein transglycosylase-like protein
MMTWISMACIVSAAPPAGNLAADPAWTSTVRADGRSGRLIRTIEVRPRVITPIAAGRATPDSTPLRSNVSSNLPSRSAAREEIRQLAAAAAERHRVDPDLVDAVIQVESNYNPAALSSKGAMGLMQLIPATARRFGVRNPFDPKENLEGGVQYLKYLQDLYGDNRLALAAYNAGEGAVQRYGWIPPYRETQSYVFEVGRRYGNMRRNRTATAAVMPRPPRIQQTVDAEGRILIRFQ